MARRIGVGSEGYKHQEIIMEFPTWQELQGKEEKFHNMQGVIMFSQRAQRWETLRKGERQGFIGSGG